MAKEWNPRVKQSRNLTVFNNLGGNWPGLFQSCLTEFNRLLSTNGLNLRLTVANSANSANVVMGSGSGQVTFTYRSQTFNRNIPGTVLHGRAFPLINGQNQIEKLYIFVPSNPQMNAPGGSRSTGAEVMRTILLHELIHACGLEDADHSNDDFFIAFAHTQLGNTPNDDRLGMNTPNGAVWFPPYFLSGGTVGKISGNW